MLGGFRLCLGSGNADSDKILSHPDIEQVQIEEKLDTLQYLRQIAKMGKNVVQTKNQLIDFIGLSKTHFWRK